MMHPASAATFDEQRWQREATSAHAAGLPCKALRHRERVARVEHITPSEGCPRCKHGFKRPHSVLRLGIFYWSRTSICSRFFSRPAGTDAKQADGPWRCLGKLSQNQDAKQRANRRGQTGRDRRDMREIGFNACGERALVGTQESYTAVRGPQGNRCRLQGKSYSARFRFLSSKRAVTSAPERPHHSGAINAASISLSLHFSVQR